MADYDKPKVLFALRSYDLFSSLKGEQKSKEFRYTHVLGTLKLMLDVLFSDKDDEKNYKVSFEFEKLGNLPKQNGMPTREFLSALKNALFTDSSPKNFDTVANEGAITEIVFPNEKGDIVLTYEEIKQLLETLHSEMKCQYSDL